MKKTSAFTTWSETTIAFLDGYIGVRNAPMLYLKREREVNDPLQYADLLPNKLYSDDFLSIDFELIAYLVFDDDEYISDNKVLFQLLSIALKGSLIHSSFSSF